MKNHLYLYCETGKTHWEILANFLCNFRLYNMCAFMVSHNCWNLLNFACSFFLLYKERVEQQKCTAKIARVVDPFMMQHFSVVTGWLVHVFCYSHATKMPLDCPMLVSEFITLLRISYLSPTTPNPILFFFWVDDWVLHFPFLYTNQP